MPREPRDIVLHSHIFDVERMTIQLPAGGAAERYIVRHPGAVCVMALRRDGSLVTIRNRRIAVDEWLHEFCAGKLEPGEDPCDAARRELEEETGHSAGCMTPLGTFFTSPGFTDERMHAFLATDLTPCPTRLEADERIEVQFVDQLGFERMIAAGEVCDGKTLATYLRWKVMQP
ncbi:MAG: NUDIX hydrolase [Planctomycetes bacterium]|nr:NUDIX hydrolase [Planctomycetota bacterium]